MNLANRCRYDRVHAETVQRNALLLFDEMKRQGVHKMDDEMRMLLSSASLLHDIGEFISYPKHNFYSYIIILNSFLPGFDNEELRTMALLTKFHHKNFPRKGSKQFANMDDNEISDILMCAMMLKIADILDRHRNSSVDAVGVSVSPDAVTIRLESESDISMEIWKLKTAEDDFKDVFGLDLRILRA
jgi:exopolyphosphatase/guanosine-5'-triphosphate,3'-diphosphate pyrophosphatase